MFIPLPFSWPKPEELLKVCKSDLFGKLYSKSAFNENPLKILTIIPSKRSYLFNCLFIKLFEFKCCSFSKQSLNCRAGRVVNDHGQLYSGTLIFLT